MVIPCYPRLKELFANSDYGRTGPNKRARWRRSSISRCRLRSTAEFIERDTDESRFGAQPHPFICIQTPNMMPAPGAALIADFWISAL
jgi:hypothetical protein